MCPFCTHKVKNSTQHKVKVEKLSIRRFKLCLKFARRAEKHKKYSKWFNPMKIAKPSTRSDKVSAKLEYTPVPFRKIRYKKSPIPYLTQLLNEHHTKKRT